MRVVEKVLTVLGQTVERVLTGRSEFQFTTSDFHQTSSVHETIQARMVLREVQQEVAEGFGLRLRAPVLLDLERPMAWGWKAAVAGQAGQVGRYAPRWLGQRRIHRIVIVPGLPRSRFRAVVAHELVHAWQAELGILRSSRGLREGMARWVEYHVLLRVGLVKEAGQLLKLRRFLLGRSLRDILERERAHGREATLAWLRSLDDEAPEAGWEAAVDVEQAGGVSR